MSEQRNATPLPTEEITLCGLRCLIRYAQDPGRSPGILFLHGAGSRNSMETLKNHSLLCEGSDKLRAFGLLMPLLEGDTWFDVFEHLIGLAECAAGAMQCDPDRMSLMGVSMGGFGAWQLGMSCPEHFAALVPLCGGGQDWNAARLKQVPVWAFHGALDTTVDPAYSGRMVQSLQRAGGDVRLTLYPDLAHNCWSRTFADDGLFGWLEAARRAGVQASADEAHRGSAFG